MKNAIELLDVIESSHLELTDKLAEQRDEIVQLIDKTIKSKDDTDGIAENLAGILVDEGVVLGDRQNVEEVIAEYLHVVANEEESLGDEEKNFLESFLK